MKQDKDLKSPNKQTQARIYPGQLELDHDLFKLEIAKLKRNESYHEEISKAIYVEFTHSHFFHTIDSSGRTQETSTSQGGHFHKMTVTNNGKDQPTATCSPPMRYARKNVDGYIQRVMIELDHDHHTHEVVYVRSEKIKPRTPNVEWAKLQSEMDARQVSRVDGVKLG